MDHAHPSAKAIAMLISRRNALLPIQGLGQSSDLVTIPTPPAFIEDGKALRRAVPGSTGGRQAGQGASPGHRVGLRGCKWGRIGCPCTYALCIVPKPTLACNALDSHRHEEPYHWSVCVHKPTCQKRRCISTRDFNQDCRTDGCDPVM